MSNGSSSGISAVPMGFGQTARRDWWWVQPVAVFLGFSAFVIYATWSMFTPRNYYFGNYLSPFFEPELWGVSPNAWFGARPPMWPSWFIYSPAMLILIFPLGFRLTCYYYRGAYYKSFWADPPSCTVGEPRSHYRGENSFPLIVQNIHRYFLYAALVFVVFLSDDAWRGMWFAKAGGGTTFGVGVGTIILTVNAILIACYTFGCHSLRHLVGGGIDRLSQKPVRRDFYRCVSCLNRKHMPWAWFSLVWIGFADLYIRLCAMGVVTDWRIF